MSSSSFYYPFCTTVDTSQAALSGDGRLQEKKKKTMEPNGLILGQKREKRRNYMKAVWHAC